MVMGVLYVVYTDGNPVYAVPSKWKAEGADKILHKCHPHNTSVFVPKDDPDRNNQMAENRNALVKTTTLFPARGSYEPNLHKSVQEFAFHRDDGYEKLPR